MKREWWGWHTWEDIELVCEHTRDLDTGLPHWTTMQLGSLESGVNIYTCPDCGQRYEIELKITPMFTEARKSDVE